MQTLKELAPYLDDEFARAITVSVPDIVDRFKENPYCLLDFELEDYECPTFDQIDSKVILKTFEDRKREVRAALAFILKANEMQGNSYMDIDLLCKRTLRLLSRSAHPLNYGSITAFLNYYSSYFAIDYTRNIVSRLKTRQEEWKIFYGLKALKENYLDFFRYEPIDKTNILDDSQLMCARNVIKCKSNVALLTGGPGTGKTTTIKAVVDGIDYYYPEYNTVLLAPSGKAAARLQEVFLGYNVKIKTIHMFCGFRDENDPSAKVNIKKIATDIKNTNVIIIDESSMVAQDVLARLFEFVDFRNTKIIFVGDEDQLPAVGCGDIINTLKRFKVCHEHLTVNYRSAMAINVNAANINKGISDVVEDDSFEFINISNYNIEDYLIENIVYRVNNNDTAVLLNPYKAIGRKGNIRSLNRRVQIARFGEGPYVSSNRFEANDRVLLTHTNYAKKYFNGYTGTYIGYDRQTDSYKVLLDYLDKVVLVNNDFDIQLNYAQTIHKSQGSEYDYVDVYIPEYTKFVTRRALYTAITRGKKKVRVFSTPDIYRLIVNNKDVERNSYINIWIDDDLSDSNYYYKYD